MNRRTFLSGSLAAGAAALVPSVPDAKVVDSAAALRYLVSVSQAVWLPQQAIRATLDTEGGDMLVGPCNGVFSFQ